MADKSRVVQLIGRVTAESVSRISREVLELWGEDPQAEITLYVASSGGEIMAGLAFYELVKTNSIPLTTVGIGEITSMGVIVWLAGSKRKITPNSSFLINEVERYFEKEDLTLSELERETQECRFKQDILIRIVAAEVGKSRAEVAALAKENRRLSVAEAIEFGFLGSSDTA